MKTLHQLAATSLLVVVLAACTNASKPTESSKPTMIMAAVETIQSTQVVIPTDLAFSTPLVQVLSQAKLNILSVQSSTYMAMFPSTEKAAWIRTNEGIVEVIFFADSSEAEQIQITEQPNPSEARYLYTIHAPPPTLLHDQIIDAVFPLYFTISGDMLLVTSSEELNRTLKHIFSGQ